MTIQELLKEVHETKMKLAELCKSDKACSVEYTDTLVALMALQDSLVYALLKATNIVSLKRVA
jgi:hypothetical protein